MVGDYEKFSPISPQLMKPYVTKTPNPNYNIEKNDVWSLGITMVCASTICNFRDMYYFEYVNIVIDKLNERLAIMKRLYSDYFVR